MTSHHENFVKKMQSSLRRTNSFVLKQPVSIEESIPEDLDKSMSKRPFNPHAFLKRVTVAYMRSNNTRILIILGAVISCILYVVETYEKYRGQSRTLPAVIDIAIFIIFLMDYFFNIMYAPSKPLYIFSFQGFIDLASLFAIVNLVSTADLSFLPLFRLLRLIKVMRLFRTASIVNVERPTPPSASEAILFEIASLIIGILLAIFLGASVLYTIIQQDGDAFVYGPDSTFSMQEDTTFFDCVYMVLVFVSTLGFGDFVPNNTVGRLYVVVVLLLALTVIPLKVGQLVDVIGKKPRYMNEYVPEVGQPHILICANLNQWNFQKLITLILSQGTNDPEIIDDAVPVALLSSVFPTPQLQLLLVHPMNARKVQFFVGSVKSPSDLQRVRAAEAKAIFIFADTNFTDTIDVVDQDDYSTKLKVVSIINFLSGELSCRSGQSSRPTIICQTVSHEVCFSLLNFGVDRIISINNMKYKILAYTALFPGFLSIITNLTIPSAIYNKRGTTTDPKKWKNEYEWGNSFELVEIPVQSNTSSDFKRLSFSQACRFLYQWSKGTTILAGIFDWNGQGSVVINPERKVRIGECKSIFMICNNLELALAMLNTDNLRTILRRLRSMRNFGGTEELTFMDRVRSSGHHTHGPDSPKPPMRSRSDTETASAFQVPLNMVFRRNTGCFKQSLHSNPKPSETINPEDHSAKKTSDDYTKNQRAVSAEDNVSETQNIVASKSERARSESAIVMGSKNNDPLPHAIELSRIPSMSIRLGMGLRHEHIAPQRFQEHIVLVCAFSPQFAIPRIVAAIDTFVVSIRSKSWDPIVVLATRAPAIEEFARKKTQDRNETFDPYLTFVRGVPNSIRGLQSVDVCHARCVVIIGNEYQSADDNAQDSEEVQGDLYIVLAALELDSIMKSYKRRLEREHKMVKLPIVIQELYNETTINFLPDSYHTRKKVGRTWDRFTRRVTTSRRGIALDDEVPPSTPGAECGTQARYYELVPGANSATSRIAVNDDDADMYLRMPALSQGRVLSQNIIDGLTVQMLYNPNILEFWQVLMGMEKRAPVDLNSTEHVLNFLHQGSFDKLDIPTAFSGTFEDLFDLLLSSYGTVALGLYRNPPEKSSYVAILPPANSPVYAHDQVFVLLTGKSDMAKPQGIQLGHSDSYVRFQLE